MLSESAPLNSSPTHCSAMSLLATVQQQKVTCITFLFLRIESADLDGSNRRVILEKLPHPFAISVFGSAMFWTDWSLKRVVRANKLSGGSVKPLLRQTLTYKPMDIQVISSDRQNCMFSLVHMFKFIFHGWGVSDKFYFLYWKALVVLDCSAEKSSLGFHLLVQFYYVRKPKLK